MPNIKGMNLFIVNICSDDVFYAVNFLESVDHVVQNAFVLDPEFYVSVEYTVLGGEVELSHIDTECLGYEAGDFAQKTDFVNALERNPDRKVFLKRTPLRYNHTVAVFAGESFRFFTGLFVDLYGILSNEKSDYRISRNRLAAVRHFVFYLVVHVGVDYELFALPVA